MISTPATTLAAYLVRGSDEVAVETQVRRLVDEASGGDRSAVTEVGPGDDGIAEILDAARTPPLISARRVILGRDLGHYSSAQVKPLVEYLSNPLDSTTLVLVGGGGQLARGLVDAVRRAGHVIDADVPRGKARSGWLAAQLRSGPVRLDAAAAAAVDRHLGEDLSRIHALLDILGSAYGDGARLGQAEVAPFLGEQGNVAPWELTDAIDRGDSGAAIWALRRMMAAGDRHPLAVLSTLHSHYARMLRLDGDPAVTDEASAARALGMTGSTFPARKALTNARRVGRDGIARAIQLLAEADLALKGAIDWPGEVVMEVLVARLSLLRRTPAGPRTRAGTRARSRR